MTDGPEERPPRRSPFVGLVIVAGLVLVAAGVWMTVDRRATGSATTAATPASVTAAPTPSTVLPSVPGPFSAGRTPLPGFGEVAVRVTGAGGGERLFCMLAARTQAQLERGLMTVTDPTLGGYDGMLFVFDRQVENGFWMRNTPMPLSIAYLSKAGRLVSRTDMAPCRDSPDCPSYEAAGPYAMAIEVPKGGLGRLGIDGRATVAVGGRCAAAG